MSVQSTCSTCQPAQMQVSVEQAALRSRHRTHLIWINRQAPSRTSRWRRRSTAKRPGAVWIGEELHTRRGERRHRLAMPTRTCKAGSGRLAAGLHTGAAVDIVSAARVADVAAPRRRVRCSIRNFGLANPLAAVARGREGQEWALWRRDSPALAIAARRRKLHQVGGNPGRGAVQARIARAGRRNAVDWRRARMALLEPGHSARGCGEGVVLRRR